MPPPAAFPRKTSPSTPENAIFGPFFVRWANFFALTPTTRPRRANFFAHRTQPRVNCETAITTATADADQRETTITNARPRTATIETDNTNASEKRAKNTQFSPAKAMTVTVEARPAPAKATTVSDNRPSWPTGPGCGTRVRWRGLAGLRDDAPISDQAPLVWRAPEGPEGTGGLRGAAPNAVRSPSLAGGRARRRPEHQRCRKQHHQ